MIRPLNNNHACRRIETDGQSTHGAGQNNRVHRSRRIGRKEMDASLAATRLRVVVITQGFSTDRRTSSCYVSCASRRSYSSVVLIPLTHLSRILSPTFHGTCPPIAVLTGSNGLTLTQFVGRSTVSINSNSGLTTAVRFVVKPISLLSHVTAPARRR